MVQRSTELEMLPTPRSYTCAILAYVVRCCAFTKLPFPPLLSLLWRTQGLHISSSSRRRVGTLLGSGRRYLWLRLWLVGSNCDLFHPPATLPCGQVSPRCRNCPDPPAAHAVSTVRRRPQCACCFTHHLSIQLFEFRALFIIPTESVHDGSQDVAAGGQGL